MFQKAFLTVAILLVASYGIAGNWTPTMGPRGGAFSAFEFHPTDSKLIFASGENEEFTAGVYRSRDGGTTWARLGIRGIVRIHSMRPNNVYLAADAFMVSMDLGSTWQTLSDSSYPRAPSDLQFHSSNPDIVYTVAIDGELTVVFRSNDGGRTWTKKNTGLSSFAAGDPANLVVDPRNGNIVYVQNSAGRVFKSTNGGETWIQRSNGLVLSALGQHQLVIDPNNINILYTGGWKGIFKSVNGGTNWISTRCNCRVRSIAVDPKNSSVIYAAGEGMVSGAVMTKTVFLKSINGGASWQALVPPLTSAAWSYLGVAVNPVASVVLLGTQGRGILRSNSAGASWTIVNAGVFELGVSDLEANPQFTGNALSVSPSRGSNMVFITRNSGQSWQLVKSLDSLRVQDIGIHPSNGNILAAIGDFGFAFSSDNGHSWFINQSVTGTRVAIASDLSIYIITSENRVRKSIDNGHTWQLPNVNFSSEFPVSLSTAQTGPGVYVGTDRGRVFRSMNSGTTWSLQSAGLPFSGVVHQLYVGKNPQHAFAIVNRDLYRSLNGGGSWQLSKNGVLEIALDRRMPSRVFAIDPNLIYISNNNGSTWSDFSTQGLPPRTGDFTQSSTELDSGSSLKLYLGTSRRVFRFIQ